jgi:hypothetical protein
VDPVGSGRGPVAGSCEYGDEPSGFVPTELVSFLKKGKVCLMRSPCCLSVSPH